MSQNNPIELGQILLGLLEVFGVNILVMVGIAFDL